MDKTVRRIGLREGGRSAYVIPLPAMGEPNKRPRISSRARAATWGALVACACGDGGKDHPTPAPPAEFPAKAEQPAPAPRPAPARSAPARWIAVGGASAPIDAQVSIEQDVALAREVLGEGGIVLFAAGAGAPVVQVEQRAAAVEGDPLRLELADLFAPRAGRGATYRAPEIPVDGAATSAELAAQLRAELAADAPPLFLYFAGHGNFGATPADATVALWDEGALSVTGLASILDEPAVRRPIRMVITSCFGGGFAELAFDGAKEKAGATPRDRCALFATTWDLPASGCDPNPDRRVQESYGLHFLNALRGLDRDGKLIERAELDVDGDGELSLLEAHTRARIAARSLTTPTTTSERFLRAVAPKTGRPRLTIAPEERAVIAALGPGLNVETWPDLERALDDLGRQLDESDAAIAELEKQVETARKVEEAAYTRAASQILSQWPVLDDPWHPAFERSLTEHRDAIAQQLATSDLYVAYRSAAQQVMEADAAVWARREAAAPLENLYRAVETAALAARLAARGGASWKRYQQFLACERWVP